MLDNGTVGMTGTQRSMSTGETLDDIILGAGVATEHLRVIEPIPGKHDANVAVIREELAHPGPASSSPAAAASRRSSVGQ